MVSRNLAYNILPHIHWYTMYTRSQHITVLTCHIRLYIYVYTFYIYAYMGPIRGLSNTDSSYTLLIYSVIYICLYELSGGIICVFYITLICMYVIVLCNGMLIYAISYLTQSDTPSVVNQWTYPSRIPLRVYISYIHTFNG